MGEAPESQATSGLNTSKAITTLIKDLGHASFYSVD